MLNDHLALNRAFGMKELNDLLSRALSRPDEEVKKKSFAPSGLGYASSCPRKWFYAFNGTTFQYESTPSAVANMEAGTDAGARWAKVFKKAGILVDDEVLVEYEDPPIKGYIDAIVRWKGEEIPVEIKTTKNSTWHHRLNSNSVPGYQMIQLLIYMYITNKERGFFFTENKDENRVFVLPVKMTDERRKLVEETFAWMRMVKANADKGLLPTRPFIKSSIQCKGCQVRKVCWDGFKRGAVNGSDPAPGVVDLPVLRLPK